MTGSSVTQPSVTWSTDVLTLAIDVGGSGLKAAVLARDGQMLSERIRVDTPYPCPPEVLLQSLVSLAAQLPKADRASVGFPGLVRGGRVFLAHNLSRRKPGEGPDPELASRWYGFHLSAALADAFGLPVRVANDADVQGCAVVEGRGFEFVVTLGTGCGTALFNDGRLLPHLELGHAPFRRDQTFEEQIGDEARRSIGDHRWERRVVKALAAYDRFLFYDRVYVGGGNAKRLTVDLGPKAVVVPNKAGILGGIRIWDLGVDE